jgi:hypothetical protein
VEVFCQLGWCSPSTKFEWIICFRQETSLSLSLLKELGRRLRTRNVLLSKPGHLNTKAKNLHQKPCRKQMITSIIRKVLLGKHLRL